MFDAEFDARIDRQSQNVAKNGRWCGVIPPLPTPLSSGDELDVDGLVRLVEHVIAGGVHGVFILGTTGEGPHLSQRVRRQLITETCRFVGGRIRVMVGVSDTSQADAADLARFAADSGADALVSAAPYYFALNELETVEYFQQLARETPLPLFLYNMPQMTKSRFSSDGLRRLMEAPTIAGLKDSSGNLVQFEQYLAVCRERSDWSVFVGPEQLLCKAVSLGADGGISGGANIHPRLFVEAYDATRNGEIGRVDACQRQIEALGRLYQVGADSTSFIQGVKAALAVLGICGDAMASPFRVHNDVQRRALQVVAECGLAKTGADGSHAGCGRPSFPPSSRAQHEGNSIS